MCSCAGLRVRACVRACVPASVSESGRSENGGNPESLAHHHTLNICMVRGPTPQAVQVVGLRFLVAVVCSEVLLPARQLGMWAGVRVVWCCTEL